MIIFCTLIFNRQGGTRKNVPTGTCRAILVEGLKEHERAVVILCPHSIINKKDLRELAGTLTHEEASAMQKLIDKEFGKIEGDWGASSGDDLTIRKI